MQTCTWTFAAATAKNEKRNLKNNQQKCRTATQRHFDQHKQMHYKTIRAHTHFQRHAKQNAKNRKILSFGYRTIDIRKLKWSRMIPGTK